MARSENPTLALGLLAFCTSVIVLIVALLLGFYIEATPSATVDSAKGQLIAVPGVLSLVASVVALNARRHGWGLVVAWTAVAAAAVAVLLVFLLPGSRY